MRQSRRALVLTDEAARHPFRQSLPPHLRQIEPAPAAARIARRFALTASDWRGFLAAYCTAFLVTLVFIG